MGPKRIAVVILAVVAAIAVVTSVIAAAIAALPRENRYAIGAQSGARWVHLSSRHSERSEHPSGQQHQLGNGHADAVASRA